MITAQEKKLLGLGENDPLPEGGRNYKVYSFTGFGADSSKSWSPSGNSLRSTIRYAFGMEFYPGSLNVRLIQGIPWWPPVMEELRKVQFGVFEVSWALPVILNEMLIGVTAAVGVRGFDPATGEKMLVENLIAPEMYGIFSPVNIRERLGLTGEDVDSTVIDVRLLSGDLLQLENE